LVAAAFPDEIPGTQTVLTEQILVARKLFGRGGVAVTEFLAPGASDRTNSYRQEIVLSLRRSRDEIPGTRTV
jgi:hypothetical protein